MEKPEGYPYLRMTCITERPQWVSEEDMEVNEHVHGVCHVDMLGGGDYKVRQFQIIDGKVY